ncbi:20255_t:CDS:1, partial [Gigaspora margarita]
ANSSQTPSASTNSTRSKLFNAYQNMTKNLKDAPTVQLPNFDNIESGPSVNRKRTEELYEHLPEMENTNPTVDYEPEANEINSTKNIKPRNNQKILTHNQRKDKG